MLEEVLLEHIARLAVYPEQSAASLVSQADCRLCRAFVRFCGEEGRTLLDRAAHEEAEHGPRILALIDALGEGEERASAAELTHKLKLDEQDVDDLAVDYEAAPSQLVAG